MIMNWEERKGIDILKGLVVTGHRHMVVQIPIKYSVGSVVGFLKEKSLAQFPIVCIVCAGR